MTNGGGGYPLDRGTAVAEVLLSTLAINGVERLWFCSGSELVPLQEAAVKLRSAGAPTPEIATAVHEHVAISAAMGEAMVSGGFAATVAHADLGLANYGAELHTALRGQLPLLVINGYPATAEDWRTSPAFYNQQRWNPFAVASEYTKWRYRLSSYDDVGLVVARALQVAGTAPNGPSHLVVPAEVLAATETVGGPRHVDQLQIPRLGGGDEDGVAELAKRLLAAQRPLLLTDRIGRDVDAVAALDELADEFGIAVETTRFRMNLRSDHPARWTRTTVSDADVVLVIEHALPWMPAVARPAPDAYVAVIGTDPIAAEIPLYEFPANMRLLAEPAAFLRALLEALRVAADAGARERIGARRAAHRSLASEGIAAETRRREGLLAGAVGSHATIGAAIDAVIEPDDIFVDELGDPDAVVRRDRPGTLFQNGGSSLGWATSAAVGARLASGDRPTVCAIGDGGYLFGVPTAALWLQQAHDAPVLTVVANNRGYRTGTSHVDAYFPGGHAAREGSYVGGAIDPAPDYAAQTVAAGGFGETVHHPRDLVASLERARKAVEVDRVPAVVDVQIPRD